MDPTRFDALARVLSAPDSRRRVLGLLAAVPVVGGLVLLDPDDAEAKRKRRRHARERERGHDPDLDAEKKKKKKKKKKKCTPDAVTQTCAGRCGAVSNNCQQAVDCGPCTCDPACPACQICDEETGQCGADPGQAGDACGSEGQVCFGNSCCTPISTCPAGACGVISDGCGSTIDCGACAPQTCKAGTCEQNGTCSYANEPNGQPGTNCATTFCCNGACCGLPYPICSASGGCCRPERRIETCFGGRCGNVSNNCGQTVDCGACAPQTCKTGTCEQNGTCSYANEPNGQPGTNCGPASLCCNGVCCMYPQVCSASGECCRPDRGIETCSGRCGNVINNCGQTVNCGACAP